MPEPEPEPESEPQPEPEPQPESEPEPKPNLLWFIRGLQHSIFSPRHASSAHVLRCVHSMSLRWFLRLLSLDPPRDVLCCTTNAGPGPGPVDVNSCQS